MSTKRNTRGRNAARRRHSNRTPAVIGTVVVLVLAVAVIGGALWVNASKTRETSAPIPTLTTAPDSLDVSLDRDGATVLVGDEHAPVTIDLYEDFLCPACLAFEETYAGQVHDALSAGTVRVRYHPINLLDARSDPPGYSLLAANSALAVADVAPDRFLDYFHSLLAAQPAEGARGYDAGQLVELGRRLDITDPRFATEVTDAVFAQAVRRSFASAAADPALRSPGVGGGAFGTPTVAVDGTRLDIVPGWLAKLTGTGASG